MADNFLRVGRVVPGIGVSMAVAPKAPVVNAGDKGVADILGGTLEQRATEVKRIILTMRNTRDIDVIFEGFWDGKLIKAAVNNIMRFYKRIKYDRLRESVTAKAKAEQSARAKAMEARDVATT